MDVEAELFFSLLMKECVVSSKCRLWIEEPLKILIYLW
jgi:hypothetical protein